MMSARQKISFLLLIFICSLVYADDGVFFTDGKPNGRWWNQLSEQYKVCFVVGIWTGVNAFFGDGVKVSITDARINTEEVKNLEKTISFVNDTLAFKKALCLPNLTQYEIVGKIDKFYEDEFNRNIPIDEAYIFICNRYFLPQLEGIEGVTILSGEEYIKKLRKKYNK